MEASCSERRGREFESRHSDQIPSTKTTRRFVQKRKLQQLSIEHLNTVPLTKGYVSLIDEDDAKRINQFLWCAMLVRGRVYAARRPGYKQQRRWVMLHRWLIDAPDGMDVDHINGDSLDNRRCNLRIATRSQNNANSNSTYGIIGLRGVSLNKSGKTYRSEIMKDGRKFPLGTFATAEEAHAAYTAARLRLYGEFAPR